MNILSSLLEFIGDFIGRYSETVAIDATKVGSAWTAGQIVARRRGDVVMVKLNGATTSALSARSVIASLPAGWRPPAEVSGKTDATGKTWYVSWNGDIKIDGGDAATHWGSITYFADR